MTDPGVASYLDRLRAASREMPPSRREELVAEIRAHIDAASSARGADGPAAIRNILDRLGPPEEIAAAALSERHSHSAYPEPGPRHRGLSVRDLAAVLLLPFGGLIFLVGWFVGVVLLWTSEDWTVRHKVIGTLVLPFGVVFPLALGALPGPGQPAWLGASIFVALLAAPIISAGWLASRAHASRRPRELQWA